MAAAGEKKAALPDLKERIAEVKTEAKERLKDLKHQERRQSSKSYESRSAYQREASKYSETTKLEKGLEKQAKADEEMLNKTKKEIGAIEKKLNRVKELKSKLEKTKNESEAFNLRQDLKRAMNELKNEELA